MHLPFKSGLKAFRANISHLQLVVAYAAISTVLLNRAVLDYIFDLHLPDTLHNLSFQFSTALLIGILQVIICLPFLILGVTKQAVVAFAFIAFITNYFSERFGVIFDSTVIESVFITNYSEISQYFNLNLFLNLILILFLSFAILVGLNVPRVSLGTRSLTALKLVTACTILLGLIAFGFYKDYASFFRNNRQVRQMVAPISPIYEIGKHLIHSTFPKKYTFTPLGQNARLKPSTSGRKKFVVMVLGETARADHFSLNGYTKNITNPLLSQENVISLLNVSSCGTATATSVPCIFSDLGRKAFNPEQTSERGNLLDVAQAAGYKVTWIDNNTGCQGLCARSGEFDIGKMVTDELCDGGICFDEILLNALKSLEIGDAPQLVVLHMLGSHGPSYYLRYPKEFEKFKPACNTSELSACSAEEVTNSYDNSLLYTDAMLTRVIDYLKSLKGVDTAMFYVSDHGESLGENGIYLHSLPYFLAPKAQRHVAEILWFSDSFLRPEQTKAVENKNFRACESSHDNVFSSLLAMLDIETDEYKPDKDIFKLDPLTCPRNPVE